MYGPLIVLAAAATAVFGATCLRLPSLVSTLLAVYLVSVADAVLVVVGLSPFGAVTRHGVAAGQLGLLAVAIVAWLLCGRPLPETRGFASAARTLAGSPVAICFAVLLALVLAYDLLLALTTPPGNWDSLTYHLARAAAWAQHGGYYWVPNAPTNRMNEFQPLAEQEITFLFVGSGSTRLYALPQYSAALAIVTATYGASRRLGFDAAVSVCASALLMTFTLVALEASTAQNDLVAASFPACSACLLLGKTKREALLAGMALGMGLGAKLSTVLVWPVLAFLAWLRGRRPALVTLAGLGAGFAIVGVWGYALNLVHSGHVFGPGLRQDVGPATSLASRARTTVHELYRLFDPSKATHGLAYGMAVAGVAAAIAAGVVRRRQAGPRASVLRAAAVAIPLAAPLLVFVGGNAFAHLARWTHISTAAAAFEPVRGEANEDTSAFGPVGTIMLLGIPVLAAIFYRNRRADSRQLALALALPGYLILLGATVAYNQFLSRFLLVPVVLTAPLFGLVLRSRAAAASLLVVATLVAFWTFRDARGRPFDSVAGPPWHLSEVQTLSYFADERVGQSDAVYERVVPARACVGAVFGVDEPSYLLWGRNRTRKVFYLPVNGAVDAAYREGLFYTVISVDSHPDSANDFTVAGWTVRKLARYWLLATAPGAGKEACR